LQERAARPRPRRRARRRECVATQEEAFVQRLAGDFAVPEKIDPAFTFDF
jgi:hypothetical protein